MRIRVIDYLANPGGGVRFTLECVKGILARHPEARVAIVSHGPGMRTYAAAFRRQALDVEAVDVPPLHHWRTQPARRIVGLPGTGRLRRWLGYDSLWHFQVRDAALEACDVAWFPWLHRHRLPSDRTGHVVASFHDAIALLWPGVVSEAQREDERITVQQWLRSRARIAVSSMATVQALEGIFRAAPARVAVIPVSGIHALRWVRAGRRWPWQESPFLLYPANTSAHKNHEVLIEGYARWGAKIPLVLTGYGADLPSADPRGRALRGLAAARGIDVGNAIIPLGYVDDDAYSGLLADAWAIVMPSLMEGGGSFPVMEAMLLGVPVVCADIPVMREQLARTGGDVLWFDPHDPDDLVRRLDELLAHYDAWRDLASRQSSGLRHRTWEDVAADYWMLFQDTQGSR